MDDLDDMDEKVIREIFMDEGIIKKKIWNARNVYCIMESHAKTLCMC